MTLDPFAGRAASARARLSDRVLAVSRDGVFLWPGIPLLHCRGETCRIIDQNRLHGLWGYCSYREQARSVLGKYRRLVGATSGIAARARVDSSPRR